MLCDNIKYQGLNWCDGAINLPGIKQDVYAIAKRDIVKWPVLPVASLTDMASLATYEGNFLLAANAKFQKVGIIVDKSPVTSASQGTRPSKTFLNTGTFVHAGTGPLATGFAKQANNDDLVYLFAQKDNQWRVLGNDMFQTDTEVEQNLGGAATDEKYTKLTCKVTDICPAPFYTGEIVTEDGIINPAENKVEEVTFTPDGGTVAPGVATIALASATAGTAIYYKVGNGELTLYAGPILTTGWATGDHIITAKATKAGMVDSVYTTATYHV